MFKPPEEELQRRRWGQLRPALPIAPEHDPGLQPSAYRPPRHRPGHLRSHSFSLADFFPPFLLQQQERLCVWALMAQTALWRLAWCLQRGERHDTSKTRTHTRLTASAAGWPGRFSPGTGTTPGHV